MDRLKTFVGLALVPSLAAAALLFTGTPAQAATMVYIENHAASVWPVTTGLRYVDGFTSSTAVYARCRTGYRCIKIYEKTIKSSWSAVTYPGNPTTIIYLNPTRRGYSWTARRNIVVHELGHAYGIGYHSAYCTNIMWPNVKCPNGTYPTLRFTDPQRAILRTH